MIQITPQMRVLVAIEPVDFRRGIDGLAQVCRAVLKEDPMSGAVIVFRNRQAKAIKILLYDGQGFWLCQKRMSSGKFRHWPAAPGGLVSALWAHEFHVLISGGDPSQAKGAPLWRPLNALIPSHRA